MLRFTEVMSLVLFAIISFALPSLGFANIGAEWNPTGDPIGGGPGYSDSIRHQDADYVVYNVDGLLSALSSASAGDIVYVWDTCNICMNGHSTANISTGVTLASGRGRTVNDTISWGALIYYDSVGAAQWEMFRFSGSGNNRITGLRFRGSYSCLEGRSGTDSFPTPVAAEAAICINKDSCEIDNCEFWGFGYCPIYCNDGVGSRIHHNYLHHGNHVYHGYGITVGGDANITIEANYWDYYLSQVMGGSGAGSIESHYTATYNIGGAHSCQEAFDRHYGANDSCAADHIRNNTVRFNGYPCSPYDVTGVDINGYPIDSVFINNNWFWGTDSAHAISVWNDPKIKIWDNHFGENPPPSMSGRLPVAHIVASLDSGSAPLTVTFQATGSYDPDGEIIASYWNFGDRNGVDNYARFTNIDHCVQHTFDTIGIYRVELMVTDNTGIPSFDYIDINVAPNDGRKYLSLWVKDRYHGNRTGYYSKQIMLDDWLAWEDDIAGEDDWEHVILDVTDSLTGKDSVTITYRLYCTRDTVVFQGIGIETFIDDVVLYGADIINGNFESGVWTGTAERTDGNWIPSRSTHYYCWDWRGNVRSGLCAYHLGRWYDDVATAGDYCKIEQRVAVGGSGIIPSNNDANTCSLRVPYPNPARVRTQIGYMLSQQSAVSFDVYDVSGRFIRNLVEGIQTPGEYEVIWDGKNSVGKDVANGIYFFHFVAGDYHKTKQMVWVR